MLTCICENTIPDRRSLPMSILTRELGLADPLSFLYPLALEQNLWKSTAQTFYQPDVIPASHSADSVNVSTIKH